MTDRRAELDPTNADHSAVHAIPPGPRPATARECPSAEELDIFSEGQLLQGLLATTLDAVYFKSARGKFIRVNPAMAARLGLPDPADAPGKTASEVPNAEVALSLHDDDEALLQSGREKDERVERRDLGNAGVAWTLATRVLLRDREGRAIGIMGVLHDVTEQKRAEERICEAVGRRDQFLAMLSHELRNPLAAIVSATSLLKKDFAEDALPRPLAILQRQSLHMARLLDDLLDANRVTENRIDLRKQVLDLRVVAQDAADALRGLLSARGVLFSATLGDSPIWVEGDAARLQQVQENLLHNAAKYTPSGGHVTLVTTVEGDRAVIRVADDGAGIPPEMLETVFELFVQTTGSLDRAHGGLGLGLTVVRSLIGMHGGTVRARSDGANKGAEFEVRLPMASSLPPVETAQRPGNTPTRQRLPRHAKIAIVDDNTDCRDMLYAALSVAGFHCQAADNGVDGLALIETERPDVAIIDLGLPAMNGFELARRIRAEPRNATVRLVALTGYGAREDRERALAAGFDDHLVKPIEPGTLLDYIKGGTN